MTTRDELVQAMTEWAQTHEPQNDDRDDLWLAVGVAVAAERRRLSSELLASDPWAGLFRLRPAERAVA